MSTDDKNQEQQTSMQLSRRSTLLGMALGASTLAASSLVRAATSEKSAPGLPADAYDVIVIGAGMAGATTARELGARGKKCLVLEARNRLGGRTWTADIFGQPSEVGGQWIHWYQPHVWAEIKRYGLEIDETPGANPTYGTVLINNELKNVDPADSFAMLDKGMKVFCGDLINAFPRPYDPNFDTSFLKHDDISIAQRLKQIDLDITTHTILESFFATAVSGSLETAGMLDQIHWYARADNDMGRLLRACTQYYIKSGTSSLINSMLNESKADVRTSKPVRKVEQTASGVTVTTESGEVFKASACVVAMPMNCWNDIQWSPALLPGKVAASKERHVGAGFKLKIKVKGNKGAYQSLAGVGHPVNMVYTDHFYDDHTTLFCMGYPTPGFDYNNKALVLKEVEKLLPDAEVLDTFAYDWTNDPYSKGSWCDYKVGMWSKYGADMRKTEGRIVFAGSDVADGWRGFIDGAIETGLRAGRVTAELLSSKS
ncbi:flavin monoamine oxidase family protein [Pseudomonas japonica]|uniref:flavin monoamine oxidase family protein n=1 Tax=Pseudomonas japonica TaxID=256466 RepID=UPI002158FE7B|nr:FAD-dependent oxidoreductase [Pseudomonas japonica]